MFKEKMYCIVYRIMVVKKFFEILIIYSNIFLYLEVKMF